MNSHENGRTRFAGRKLLIERIGATGLMPAVMAAAISARMARSIGMLGKASHVDCSARPRKKRTTIDG
ncbi:hypothetical protein [Bacillus anthracis]|uniref:hypothetical protein n=1 Tax=Bacillus anthracis TaxID=1392 RepID=UPI0039A5F457